MREDGWRLIGAALIALGAFSACAAPDAHSDDFVGTWQYDIGSSYHYSCDDGRSGNDLELSYWGYRISTTSIAGQLRAVLDQSRSGGGMRQRDLPTRLLRHGPHAGWLERLCWPGSGVQRDRHLARRQPLSRDPDADLAGLRA